MGMVTYKFYASNDFTFYLENIFLAIYRSDILTLSLLIVFSSLGVEKEGQTRPCVRWRVRGIGTRLFRDGQQQFWTIFPFGYPNPNI